MISKACYKNCVALVTLLAITACASPRHRFPDYGSIAKAYSTIPVVVDLFVYRDIAGQSRGYNAELSQAYLIDAVSEIDRVLAERGFSTHVIKSMNGLSYEMSDDAEYVLSQDWKSTKEAYHGVKLDLGNDPWLTSDNRKFMAKLFLVAKELNLAKNQDQAYVEQQLKENLAPSDVPLVSLDKMYFNPKLIEGIESDVVLFIKVEGRFQKLGKFLVKGILTGAVTNALTGGIVAIPRGSYAISDVVAYNIKTREILWHSRGYSEGKNSVKGSLEDGLTAHPFIDGETAKDKERAKKRKRETINRKAATRK